MQYNFKQNQQKYNNYQYSNIAYPPSTSGMNLYSSLQGQGSIHLNPNSGMNHNNPTIFSTVSGNTSGFQPLSMNNDGYAIQGKNMVSQGLVGQLNFANKGSMQSNKKVYPSFNNNKWNFQ